MGVYEKQEKHHNIQNDNIYILLIYAKI